MFGNLKMLMLINKNEKNLDDIVVELKVQCNFKCFLQIVKSRVLKT